MKSYHLQQIVSFFFVSVYDSTITTQSSTIFALGHSFSGLSFSSFWSTGLEIERETNLCRARFPPPSTRDVLLIYI